VKDVLNSLSEISRRSGRWLHHYVKRPNSQ
jgi:hypothetical protein